MVTGAREGLLGLALALGVAQPLAAADRKQTVCTITINSADEQAEFKRRLPASRFEFVELVQPGQADWLSAACKAGIRCDVMIVSGHYDGGNEFFPERAEGQASLRVSDLESASCTESCAGLFAPLKEVYLFGCNTLNPKPLSSATAEMVRSLVRERDTRGNAERDLARLGTVYGESSRERMRQIFNGVPVIYGFPSSAPLGPVAASALSRHFERAGTAAFGRGRPSAGLLEQFAPSGLVAVPGVSEREARARWDVCQFADARLSDAQIVRHLHRQLRRDMAQVGTHLDRLQRLVSGLGTRPAPGTELGLALQELADDFISRLRFLERANTASEPAARVRMLQLARDLGWLTPTEHRQQQLQLLLALEARAEIGLDEIDVACALNRDHGLDGVLEGRPRFKPVADDLAHAALRACLGNPPARLRTLDALASADADEVQIAQTYLRHHPIRDPAELRRLVAAVAAMAPSQAQVRALDALEHHETVDTEVAVRLAQLYADTSSWEVQLAVAGVLIRMDRRTLGDGERLVARLRERRLPAPAGDNRIDALIRRLQAP